MFITTELNDRFKSKYPVLKIDPCLFIDGMFYFLWNEPTSTVMQQSVQLSLAWTIGHCHCLKSALHPASNRTFSKFNLMLLLLLSKQSE